MGIIDWDRGLRAKGKALIEELIVEEWQAKRKLYRVGGNKT
jgi:hypothetical protein